jgi:hypothetical protein
VTALLKVKTTLKIRNNISIENDKLVVLSLPKFISTRKLVGFYKITPLFMLEK